MTNKPNRGKCDETHSCCNERLQKEGGKAKCCFCFPHEDCKLTNQMKTDNTECKICGGIGKYETMVDCECKSMTTDYIKELDKILLNRFLKPCEQKILILKLLDQQKKKLEATKESNFKCPKCDSVFTITINP